MKLKPIAASELTSYVIDLLANRGITTAREFLKTDLDSLAKITNLSKNVVENLRAKVLRLHRPKRLNALNRYNELKSSRIFYGFNIPSCDEMLGEQKFHNGSIFEVYGSAGIGKTQLCLTIASNIVCNWKVEALYIDTKNDFSASRLFEILREKNVDNTECGHIMQRIKVESAMSLKRVFLILRNLCELLEIKSSEVTGIKLVLIDALPAVWFMHNAHEERFERKSILSQIANIIRKMSQKHLVAFLLVNLSVQSEELTLENVAPQSHLDIAENSCFTPTVRRPSTFDGNLNILSLKPTLSRYWIAVPHIRLCLKMPENTEDDSSERVVEVTRNLYGPIGINCHVFITNAGVV